MEITSNLKERESPSPISPIVPITRSDPNSPYPTTFVTADTSSFKQVVQMLTGSSDQQPHHHEPPPTTTTTGAKNFIIPPIKTTPKKQAFKLYERRNSLKNMISPLTNFNNHHHHHHHHHHQNASFSSPRNKSTAEILSPSLLDFPSLTLLSPVTPLVEDPFNKSSPSITNGGNSSSPLEEEEKAIAEKGFYFHPSTPNSEPQLLPLFPLSSPKVSQP